MSHLNFLFNLKLECDKASTQIREEFERENREMNIKY